MAVRVYDISLFPPSRCLMGHYQFYSFLMALLHQYAPLDTHIAPLPKCHIKRQSIIKTINKMLRIDKVFLYIYTIISDDKRQ